MKIYNLKPLTQYSLINDIWKSMDDEVRKLIKTIDSKDIKEHQKEILKEILNEKIPFFTSYCTSITQQIMDTNYTKLSLYENLLDDAVEKFIEYNKNDKNNKEQYVSIACDSICYGDPYYGNEEYEIEVGYLNVHSSKDNAEIFKSIIELFHDIHEFETFVVPLKEFTHNSGNILKIYNKYYK